MPEENPAQSNEVEDGEVAEPAPEPTPEPQEQKSLLTKPPTTPPAAPEDYSAFKLPDGFTADDALIDKFKPLAKEAGLSQDAAQKLVDLYADAVKTQTQAQEEAWRAQAQEWLDTSEKDPYVMKTLDGANRVIAMFDPEHELLDWLTATGQQNMPALLRFLGRISEKVSEASLVAGTANAPVNTPKPMEERFYPQQK